MIFFMWVVFGCEQRPEPGQELVFVKESVSLSESDAEKSDQAADKQELDVDLSSDKNQKATGGASENVAEDDFFVDNNFELSSEELSADVVIANEPLPNNVRGSAEPVQEESTSGQPSLLGQDSNVEAPSALTLGAWPVQLVEILGTTPPRGVLRLPSGEEIVIETGSLIPDAGLVVMAIGSKSVSLVKVSVSGDRSSLEPIYLTPLY